MIPAPCIDRSEIRERCAEYLAERESASPHALAELCDVPVATLVAALSVDPARFTRVAGEGCWFWCRSELTPAQREQRLRADRQADLVRRKAMAEKSERAGRRGCTRDDAIVAPWIRPGERRVPAVVRVLREHGPQRVSDVARLGNVAVHHVSEWVAACAGQVLRTRIRLPNIGWQAWLSLPDQDVQAAIAAANPAPAAPAPEIAADAPLALPPPVVVTLVDRLAGVLYGKADGWRLGMSLSRLAQEVGETDVDAVRAALRRQPTRFESHAVGGLEFWRRTRGDHVNVQQQGVA